MSAAVADEGRRLLAKKRFADAAFNEFRRQVCDAMQATDRGMDTAEQQAVEDALKACRDLFREAVNASLLEAFTIEELSFAKDLAALGRHSDRLTVAMGARMPVVTAQFGREFERRIEALPL